MLINIGSGLIRMTSKALTLVEAMYSTNGSNAHKINASGDRLIIKHKE